MGNTSILVLTVLQIDVIGCLHQLQLQCLKRRSTDDDLDVKQGRLTVVNPLCKLLVPAANLLDDFIDVLFIDVPDAATDVILGAGRYHDVQDKAG